MNVTRLLALIMSLTATQLFANTIHFSPEIKTGPYIGSGFSGYGIQLGLRDVYNMESIYLSYTDTQAQFLLIDEDQITTYRIGAQMNIPRNPYTSFQVEVGYATYNGTRNYWGSDNPTLEQSGLSTSIAGVVALNRNFALKLGMDLNFLDKKSTYLSYSVAPTYSTGLVLSF